MSVFVPLASWTSSSLPLGRQPRGVPGARMRSGPRPGGRAARGRPGPPPAATIHVAARALPPGAGATRKNATCRASADQNGHASSGWNGPLSPARAAPPAASTHTASTSRRRSRVMAASIRPRAANLQRVSDYVFTMYRVDKFYGPDRQVLGNISLSFLPGAKIGVLGPNGAGKSTVLRIMAGKEEPSSGTAELARGATVGLLEQEPELDPAKDVRGNVEDGVRALRDLLDRFNAISARFAEPDADYDALLAEQATVQEQIDRHDAWSLDAALDRAMDALRLPEGDRDVTALSGGERRRVALCPLPLSSPDPLLLDEPTNHLDAESVAWLE